MNQNKRVSVCIPFYNLESYVNRCLDSVLGNTYQNIEVICVNDGSTDRTSKLLHQYAEEDSRVIVIDKENGGLVSARKAAMDVATGEFISFVDGDDWLHHQFFEMLMTVQEKTDADVVVCGYEKTDHIVDDAMINTDNLIYQMYGVESVSKLRDVRALIWGRIFSSRLMPNIKVDDDICIGEDAALNILFLGRMNTTRIAVIEEKLYYYFQRHGSLVHTLPHRERIKVSDFFEKHIDDIESEYGKQIVIHEILRSMFSYRYLEMFAKDKRTVRRHCKELYWQCKSSWTSLLSLSERTKYVCLYHFPFIYRVFRIINDPTMLEWERRERKRKHNNRNKG